MKSWLHLYTLHLCKYLFIYCVIYFSGEHKALGHVWNTDEDKSMCKREYKINQHRYWPHVAIVKHSPLTKYLQPFVWLLLMYLFTLQHSPEANVYSLLPNTHLCRPCSGTNVVLINQMPRREAALILSRSLSGEWLNGRANSWDKMRARELR